MISRSPAPRARVLGSSPMNLRPLGSTGLSVSEVGFGAWQLQTGKTWSGMSETDAIRLVHRALELGCNLFDTAPHYGDGESETFLGRALEGRRSKAVIVTKFGHGPDGKKSFEPAGLAPSVEGSLARLRTDHVDVVLLHNPPADVLSGRHPIHGAIERLRDQGKVRSYGASLDDSAEMEVLLATTRAEVIEILFNVLHQEPLASFARAEQKRVGLIAKVPLDSGWLAGCYGADAKFSDVRSRWPPEVIAKRASLVEKLRFLEQEGHALAPASLAFVLAHSAISSVIPGMKSLAQLEQNIAASSLRLSEATVGRLHALYTDQLKAAPLPW
jgi:aryl-alcohol dehydrogenase-like predicted oxidoreductase